MKTLKNLLKSFVLFLILVQTCFIVNAQGLITTQIDNVIYVDQSISIDIDGNGNNDYII